MCVFLLGSERHIFLTLHVYTQLYNTARMLVSRVAFSVPGFSNPNSPSSQSQVLLLQNRPNTQREQRTNQSSPSFIPHHGAEVARWRRGLWSLSIPNGQCELIWANKITTVHPKVLPRPECTHFKATQIKLYKDNRLDNPLTIWRQCYLPS